MNRNIAASPSLTHRLVSWALVAGFLFGKLNLLACVTLVAAELDGQHAVSVAWSGEGTRVILHHPARPEVSAVHSHGRLLRACSLFTFVPDGTDRDHEFDFGGSSGADAVRKDEDGGPPDPLSAALGASLPGGYAPGITVRSCLVPDRIPASAPGRQVPHLMASERMLV